jgi:hypothetical protein
MDSSRLNNILEQITAPAWLVNTMRFPLSDYVSCFTDECAFSHNIINYYQKQH